jgi:hypothetical protein
MKAGLTIILPCNFVYTFLVILHTTFVSLMQICRGIQFFNLCWGTYYPDLRFFLVFFSPSSHGSPNAAVNMPLEFKSNQSLFPLILSMITYSNLRMWILSYTSNLICNQITVVPGTYSHSHIIWEDKLSLS